MLRLFALQINQSIQPPADRNALYLLRKLLDAADLATLHPIKHEQKTRNECKQKAQKPDDRHLLFSVPQMAVPCGGLPRIIFINCHAGGNVQSKHIARYGAPQPDFTISCLFARRRLPPGGAVISPRSE